MHLAGPAIQKVRNTHTAQASAKGGLGENTGRQLTMWSELCSYRLAEVGCEPRTCGSRAATLRRAGSSG